MTSILVLSNMYPPHHHGGYELCCRDTVERWRSSGHDVAVLTSTLEVAGVSPSAEDERGVERALSIALDADGLLAPPLLTRWRHQVSDQRALARAIQTHRPEVVSVWGMGALSLGLLTALRRTGLPIVFVVSDDWPTYAVALDPWMRLFEGRGRRNLRRLEPIVRVPTAPPDLGQLGTWLFISETTRTRCTQLSPWAFADSTVTYGGADLEDFPISEPPDRRWGWRMVTAARLDERKGLQVAVRSLTELPDQSTLLVLTPVEGPFRRDLEALADDLGVRDRLTIEVAARSQVAARHRASDVFVFPTLWPEPFGYAPIEAMASGIPVVATGTGGSGEFLRDGFNCLRCHPDDPAGLAAAVRRLADDADLRARLLTGGRATAAELSVDRFATIVGSWHEAAAARFRVGRPAPRRLPGWPAGPGD